MSSLNRVGGYLANRDIPAAAPDDAPGHKLRARLLELGWVAPGPEAAAMAKLWKFGAAVLKRHRNDGEPADVDGGDLQAMAEKAGVLEQRTVTEPCGEGCACAAMDALPGRCFFVPDDVAAIVNHKD